MKTIQTLIKREVLLRGGGRGGGIKCERFIGKGGAKSAADSVAGLVKLKWVGQFMPEEEIPVWRLQ